MSTLQWRHNGRDSVSNYQPHDCLLNHLFRRRSKSAGNSPETGEFPAQVACNAENVSHYDDVIMTMLASQITSLTVVYSIVYSGVNQRKHQSSASLAFVRAIHRGPVNFPHKWPVTRKMFPFDDVIMIWWRHHGLKPIWGNNYIPKLARMCLLIHSHNSLLVKSLSVLPRAKNMQWHDQAQ